MKSTVLLLIALCTVSLAFAQVPQKISSQIVVRNASNELVSEGLVSVRVRILHGSPDGSAYYIETHQVTTNINGLASMEIGTGIVIVGTFANLNWSQGPFFIRTEIDPEGGDDYSISATTELLSVPYAMRAETDDDWIVNGPDIYVLNDKKVGIGTYFPSVPLEVGGNGRAFFGDGAGDQRSGLLLVGVNGGPVARIEAYDYGDAAPMSLGLNVSGGNVGIGTDDPGFPLTVNSMDGSAFFGTGDSPNSHGLALFGNSFTAGGDAVLYAFDQVAGTSKDIRLSISGGNVAIGNIDPNVKLDVSGSIEYTGTITDVSDERLKENFEPIGGAVDALSKIQGYSYNMKDDEEKIREYGVIAQEVQKVFPEMVTVVDENEGYLGVSYVQLIPVLLEAVKELKAKNDALESENSQLEKADIQFRGQLIEIRSEIQDLKNLMDSKSHR